ncbi:hypothetical protein [Kaistella sp.]|uniref:hypothetical protein n=1 Tax=Kaistella sp. TaxID=2782235 RepID=UPI003C685529
MEGPHVLFLKNKLQRFKGKIVSGISGDAEIEQSAIQYLKISDIETFGENLFFVFKDFFVSVDFGNSGTMLVNKSKKTNANFSLHFPHSEINFYGTKTQLHKGKPTDYFNFKNDILKPQFDADFILNELKTNHADKMIGDVLINQNLFAGVGNIIRTETLYHAKIYPDSLIKAIPEKKLIFLLKMVVDYAEEFLILLKTDSVEKNTLIFEKKICPKDKTPILSKIEGENKLFVCEKCQKKFE